MPSLGSKSSLGQQLEGLENQWQRFVASDRPVVTLLAPTTRGRFNPATASGRAVAEVPEWVTISARHETFEVGTVEFRGLALRDTPGVAPGAEDARGLANTGHALAAVELTDVLMVVMNPQLPTAERDLVLGVVAGIGQLDRWS